MTTQPNEEFTAIQAVHSALDPLDDDARSRVLTYIASLMEIDIGVPKKQPNGGNETGISAGDSTEGATASGPPNTAMSSFDSFADLHDVVRPEGAAEQALVAGYWLQICQKAESFDGQAANKELKNLGHGVANITKAIDGLKNQSPALALQLKKSGTSKQARKLYKITVAGQKVIEEKIKAQSNG